MSGGMKHEFDPQEEARTRCRRDKQSLQWSHEGGLRDCAEVLATAPRRGEVKKPMWRGR